MKNPHVQVIVASSGSCVGPPVSLFDFSEIFPGRLQVERQKAQAKREEMGRLQWGLAK